MAVRSQARYQLTAKDKSKKAFRSFKGSIKEATNKLGGLKTAVLGALGIGGLGALINKTVEATTETARFAKSMGISVQALSKLESAAAQSGIEADNLRDAMSDMLERTSEATLGTGEAAEALGFLGLKAEQLLQLRPEDMLGAYADALGNVGDHAERTRLALQVFGDEGGRAVLQFAEEGSEGLRKLGEEAARAGTVLSDDQAKAAVEFDKAMTSVKASIGALTRSLVVAAGPTLSKLANFLAEKIPASVDDAVDAFNRFRSTVIRLGAKAAKFLGFGDLADSLSATAERLGKVRRVTRDLDFTVERAAYSFNDLFNPAVRQAALNARKLAEEKTRAKEAAKALAKQLKEEQKILDAQREAREALAALNRKFKDEAERIFEETRTPLEKYRAEMARINHLLERGDLSIGAYNRKVKQLGEELPTVGKALADNFTDPITDLLLGLESLQDVGKKVFADLARQLVSSGVSDLLKGVSSAPTGGGGIFGGLFGGGGGGGGGGGIGGFFKGLFRANGGPLVPGRAHIVGEKGPELIVPKGQGTVIPNRALAGAGGPIVINNNFHVTTQGEGITKQSQGQLAARAGEMTSRAVRRNR